jgi:hypothetical protein
MARPSPISAATARSRVSADDETGDRTPFVSVGFRGVALVVTWTVGALGFVAGAAAFADFLLAFLPAHLAPNARRADHSFITDFRVVSS